MRLWPTGVAIVTSTDSLGNAEGMTVNSLISISLEPPLVLVSLAKPSRTLAAVEDSGMFAVSILSSGSNELCWSFARDSESREFSDFVDLEKIPIANASGAAFACRVEQKFDVADHMLIVGRVEVTARMDNSTKPLVFYNGALREIGEGESPIELFEDW
ncbi:MAG TPA: flavin reductase family protein [Actinomycetota bacterium]|nr:flavin reductase family protein [Actinomycetota bacterium]